MNVTAKQISDWARDAITALAKPNQLGTLTSVYAELSRVSGLSASWIAKFYQYAKPNPTQDTLDRLVTAIKQVSTEKVA